LIYSRINNPDLEMIEDRLAIWDQAEASLVFASGMAAISTTLHAAEAGAPRRRKTAVDPIGVHQCKVAFLVGIEFSVWRRARARQYRFVDLRAI
jgi:Cys/Met metabolism PLP-dependent enzyme